jgi:acetolactate synthase-1/2/3 large subunit
MRVADYIIDQVYKAGAHHIFSVTGGGSMFLNDAVALHKKIIPVFNHHEQASAMSAVAYSKYTNNISAVCVTTGCGGTNTITGILDAWQDSVPVIFISGNVNLNQIAPKGVRNLGVQEANIVEIVKSITKFSKIIESVDEVENVIQEAIRIATSGRPGPVWIDVPMDIQSQEMNLFSIDEEIKKSKRPLILAGNGINCAGITKTEFRELVHQSKIPVVTSFNAVDLIETDDPYYVGRVGIKGTRAGNFAMQNCDLLLVLGCRLSVPVTAYIYEHFAREAKIIVVDIDADEHSKNTVKIDKFIHSDLKIFLEENKFSSECIEWSDRCLKWREQWPIIPKLPSSDSEGIDLYDFMRKFNQHKPDESVVVTDTGSAYYVGCQSVKIKGGDRYLTSSSQLDMGFTLPACIGAFFAGSKNLIGITGDGSFQMNIQELQTIAHHKIPVKIFVWNNDGYLSIRTTQRKYFEGRESGTDSYTGVSFPSIESIAAAYNLKYVKCEKYDNLDEDMVKIFSLNEPVLIEVICQKYQEITPNLVGEKDENGKIKAKPLEDMYPFLSREEFLDNMIVSPLD